MCSITTYARAYCRRLLLSSAAAGAAAIARQYLREGYYPRGEKTAADEFSPPASLLRALLLHSAADMTGHIMSSSAPALEPAPSMHQGFGRLTLTGALKLQVQSSGAARRPSADGPHFMWLTHVRGMRGAAACAGSWRRWCASPCVLPCRDVRVVVV